MPADTSSSVSMTLTLTYYTNASITILIFETPPPFFFSLPFQPIMVLSELGKEELSALKALTETVRAGPKPAEGR